MGNPMKVCACLLLSSLLTGCSLFEDQHVINLSIQSEQDVYLVEEDQPLVLTFAYVNEGSGPIYLGSCLGPPALEKLVDGEWTLAYSLFCPDVLGPPLTIGPGEHYRATLRLTPADWDPNPRNRAWRGGDDIAGTYRVPERVLTEWSRKQVDAGTLPPPKRVYSNSFEIRRQP